MVSEGWVTNENKKKFLNLCSSNPLQSSPTSTWHLGWVASWVRSAWNCICQGHRLHPVWVGILILSSVCNSTLKLWLTGPAISCDYPENLFVKCGWTLCKDPLIWLTCKCSNNCIITLLAQIVGNKPKQALLVTTSSSRFLPIKVWW